jgi:hypothetical protein
MQGGSRSPVFCERIEEKMGLHGSATCVMRFDAATGWIVGAPGRGLNAMFVMMNAARLHVALQGIGLLDAAWQKAHAYALERRQMRAPGHEKSAAEADLIIEHPAMRRILDTQRAWIDGGRVLAYTTAVELDIFKHHPDAERRATAERWCSLVTPVLKAGWTEQAFKGSSECLQVFGGHGYVREWGVEQIVRDSRVSMIYEGTNEIQAIDLLVRKVLADGGTGLAALMTSLICTETDSSQRTDSLGWQAKTLIELTQQLVAASATNRELPYWVADDYLRAVALTLMTWAWLQIKQGLQEDAHTADLSRWLNPAAALHHWILPEFAMRLAVIRARLA